jgi:hypothetical protein
MVLGGAWVLSIHDDAASQILGNPANGQRWG